MKTLKELTEKIAQLQNEMNPASQVASVKPNHGQSKTKTDVSLGHFGRVRGGNASSPVQMGVKLCPATLD